MPGSTVALLGHSCHCPTSTRWRQTNELIVFSTSKQKDSTHHGVKTSLCGGGLVNTAIIHRHVLPRFSLVYLLCPRPVGRGALGGQGRPSSVCLSVCPSVCLSDVAYIGSNSKTKRPRKTKICTGVPQVTCDSRTDFKAKRSKVKVTGSIIAPQRNVPIFRKRIKLRSSTIPYDLQIWHAHKPWAVLAHASQIGP